MCLSLFTRETSGSVACAFALGYSVPVRGHSVIVSLSGGCPKTSQSRLSISRSEWSSSVFLSEWVALGVCPNTGPGLLVVVVLAVSVRAVIVVPVWLVHAQH